MSTSAPLPEGREGLVAAVLQRVDPRLTQQVRSEFEDALRASPPDSSGFERGVVLAGQRAAGKSTLLPIIATRLGRPATDLDDELQRHAREPLRTLFTRDPQEFRRRERTCFAEIPAGQVIAVGGGFLSLHADLVKRHLVVEIPVTWETFRARLLADRTRPRLRPELSLEDELRAMFAERARIHASVRRWSLATFLAWCPLPILAKAS